MVVYCVLAENKTSVQDKIQVYDKLPRVPSPSFRFRLVMFLLFWEHAYQISILQSLVLETTLIFTPPMPFYQLKIFHKGNDIHCCFFDLVSYIECTITCSCHTNYMATYKLRIFSSKKESINQHQNDKHPRLLSFLSHTN